MRLQADLEQTEIWLLQLIAKPELNPLNEGFAERLNLPPGQIEAHLEKLITGSYIQQSSGSMQARRLEITKKGRAYLISNGLMGRQSAT